MNIKLVAIPAIVLAAGLSLAACGSHSTPAPKAAATTQALGGCSQINSALNGVFDGTWANLPAAKTTGDLMNNFLGYPNTNRAMVAILAEKGTPPALKSAESQLNNDVNELDNISGPATAAQTAVLVPDLKAISDICGPATWASVTLTLASDVPGAPTTTPTTPAAPATPTMVSQTDIVVFSVTGTGEPSIQYGNGATTNNPSDGAGPLSDGNYLPWHASMTYSADALYYAVTAQLEGSGDISDTVTEVVTTKCSNGKHTESFPLANGSASGGYGIAQAEYTDGDTGNATQAESDAGYRAPSEERGGERVQLHQICKGGIMKKLIGIAAAIPLLALGVSAFTLPAASAAQTAPAAVKTTTGTIQLTRLGLYLNDRGNSSTNGAVVQVWHANGGAASVWQIMSNGTIRHNGLCLDVSGAKKTNGAKIDLWTCNGGANQQWNTGGWRITNPVSGKVLNDSGYGGNGTQQVLWTNVGSSNEVWGVTPFMTCQVVTELVTTPGTTTQVAEQGALLTGPHDYQTVLTMIEFNNGTAIRIDWPSVQLDVGGNQTILLGVGYPPLTSCAVIPDPDSL